ncbi:hypothetical protein SS50377_25213 [Spironucleus salmonicida]|uniref:Uncharacterized protein n=1 Tax=Spironucleus salmonicida TaxID=348837 RepID=V6LNL4_9EUKA|nr:hypothetical protein SS50377_25213 [Spironucleus salmonicida]|eukprot:EST46262.1 Hypothetical protein SS50377_13738 [Spironucleus salmonicida]
MCQTNFRIWGEILQKQDVEVAETGPKYDSRVSEEGVCWVLMRENGRSRVSKNGIFDWWVWERF